MGDLVFMPSHLLGLEGDCPLCQCVLLSDETVNFALILSNRSPFFFSNPDDYFLINDIQLVLKDSAD